MNIKGFKDANGNIQKYDIDALGTSFTAEVGQMLVVEGVDENGHPNKFSVVDQPSGVEITSSAPQKEGTVMTLNPSSEKINLYTAEETDEKLKELGTVEITSGDPVNENTVLTLDPDAEEITFYSAPEIDEMFLNFSSEGCGNVIEDKRQWKLIRTIAVPEDVAADTSGITWITNDEATEVRGFSFNVDDNGSNFSYDDIMIVGTGGYIDSEQVQPSTYFGSESKYVTCYRLGQGSAKTCQLMLYEFNRKASNIYLPTLKIATQYLQTWAVEQHGVGNLNISNSSNIIFDSVYLAQNFGGFTPGTVLKVYGRNVLGNVVFNVPGYTKEEIDAMFDAFINAEEVAY